MNYRAVLFDFDYTLGDATDAIVAGYNGALAALGHPPAGREEIRRTVGYPVEVGYTMLTGDTDETRRHTFREAFRAIANPLQCKQARLCPGARELIEALARQAIPCGVVSSKPAFALRPILERVELLPLLTLVIGGEMVTHPKPDPEGLLRAAGQLSLSPGDILYCGDTVLDAEAAQAAGCPFCAVLNGTTPAQAFAPFPRDHIAPDLNDLHRWLL